MDIGMEPLLTFPAANPLRPWEDTKAGVILVTEDPRPDMARATSAAGFFRRAAPNALERPDNFQKDVKMEGTNSASHLESTKVSKKRTQDEAETKPKKALKRCKRARTTKTVENSAPTSLPFIPYGHNVSAGPSRRRPVTPKFERTMRECL